MARTTSQTHDLSRYTQYCKSAHFDYVARDRDLIAFVTEHNATAKQLCQYGFTKTYEAAQKLANRLYKQKRIDVVGTVRDLIGRPQNLFGKSRPNAPQHEFYKTEVVTCFPHWEWEGNQNLERNCDGVAWNGDEKFYLELETGNNTTKDLKKKWERHYHECDGFILVVALTETQKRRIERTAQSVEHCTWFTVLDWLRPDPQKCPWSNLANETIYLA